MPKIVLTFCLTVLFFSSPVVNAIIQSDLGVTAVGQSSPEPIPKRTASGPPRWREDPDRLHRHNALSMSATDYLQALKRTGMQHMLTAPDTTASVPAVPLSALPSPETATGEPAGPWLELGPHGGYGGRLTFNGRVAGIRVIDDGSGGYYVFAGASGGGIWRCHSSALGTWTALAQNLPNPSVRAFAIDPSNSDHIVVCTGDPRRYKGAGIFVTSNGGTSWSEAVLPELPDYFYRVEFRLGTPLVLVAASELGIMLSEDGGHSWEFRWQGAGAATDLRLHSTDSLKMYAVAKKVGFLRSIDGGLTWGPVPGSSGLPMTATWGRASLAISPDDPQIMAVMIATINDKDISANLMGIWRTANAGTTWSNITGDLEDFGRSQMFHAQAITFEPGNTNTIWAASIELARTTDGGNTWIRHDETEAFDIGHADVTQLLFSNVSGSDILFICNDGGIYMNTISTGTTVGLNGAGATGLRLSQIDHVESRRTLKVIGLQDNGELRSQDSGANWHHIQNADGGRIAITDAEKYDFWCWWGGPWNIYRILGAGTPVNIPVNASASLHYDPFEKKIYVPAVGEIYFTNAYDPNPQWTKAAIPALHTDPSVNMWSIFGSKADGKTIYATLRDNLKRDLVVARWTGSEWTVNTAIDLAPIGGRVMTVAPSNEWPGEAWVGFFAEVDSPKVVHTTDYGITWEDVTGELAACQTVYAIATTPFDPRTVYAATGIGVFRTTDGGESWQPFQTGMPIVQAKDLKFVVDETTAGNHHLVAATFGRGLWSRSIPSRPIIYVDKTNSGTEDGSIEHPYNTVAEGVTAAPVDAIVAVRSNTYVEPQTIDKTNLLVVTWAGATTIR